MRRRAWGLSGRLVASYVLVMLVVVVLAEALMLGYQAPQLVNDARQQTLLAQVTVTAQSYGQWLAQAYPSGVRAGTVLGDHGVRAQRGLALPTPDGNGSLVVPTITGPIPGHQAITAVVVVAADGRVVTSSAPSRYPPGRTAASELPAPAIAAGDYAGNSGVKPTGSGPTQYGGVLWWVWRLADAGEPPVS